jgi:hypothetical protein
MKKLILLFALVAVAITSGCQRKAVVSYDGWWIYEIENLTDSEVIYISEESEITILPGETSEIHHEKRSVGDDEDLYDIEQYPDQPMMMIKDNPILMVEDEVMPETIWIRRLWYFNAEGPFNASYKLILTDELIELLDPSEDDKH